MVLEDRSLVSTRYFSSELQTREESVTRNCLDCSNRGICQCEVGSRGPCPTAATTTTTTTTVATVPTTANTTLTTSLSSSTSSSDSTSSSISNSSALSDSVLVAPESVDYVTVGIIVSAIVVALIAIAIVGVILAKKQKGRVAAASATTVSNGPNPTANANEYMALPKLHQDNYDFGNIRHVGAGGANTMQSFHTESSLESSPRSPRA